MKWILILGALTLFSCQEKVDCQKLEERVTGCEKEFHKRLNPEKPYNSKRLHELVHSKLTKSCKNRGGKVGDASKINGCLKRTTCAAFVDCIVGKKGEHRGTK